MQSKSRLVTRSTHIVNELIGQQRLYSQLKAVVTNEKRSCILLRGLFSCGLRSCRRAWKDAAVSVGGKNLAPFPKVEIAKNV